ncbi:VQ motif-containing protein 22-like [Cucurbita moschata]|uniref:VQ motif-containing protein 22-like n=1 Tax=Cucurbita moschata TaxID=3662 RepID=A0A6J1FXJ7_CUCMO|nr:VQ motif-containing protein 22-like [Cucurbita moschata]
MSSPGDWLQFYHQNLSTTAAPQPPSDLPTSSAMIFAERVSDATAVPTTSAAIIGSSAGNPGLNPEGRVGKPIRRRSRASRRTPTTLLNTDTTNFRAMVQQFTGGPTSSFASSISPNFPLGFRGICQSNFGTPPNAVISPPSDYLQPPQFYHSNPQPFMFPAAAHGGDFTQRISVARPANDGVAGDGFLMESAVSSQIPTTGASADSSNKTNHGNGGSLF